MPLDAGGGQAPLLKALPHIQRALELLARPAVAALRALTRFMFHHVYLPLPAIAWVLAPATVFLGYVAAAVLAPLRAGAYLAEAVHPLYVFCGVACLTGMAVGYGGRLVARLVIGSILPPAAEDKREEKEEAGEVHKDPEADPETESEVVSRDVKGKGRACEDSGDDGSSLGFGPEDSDEGAGWSSDSQSTIKHEDDD